MFNISVYLPSLFAIALLLGACDQKASDGGNTETSEAVEISRSADAGSWDAFVDDFKGEFYAYNPAVAVRNGLHEFDGQVTDRSAAAEEAYITWLRSKAQQAGQFTGLTAQQTLYQQHLLVVIDTELFALTVLKISQSSSGGYGLDPDLYLSRDYAPLQQRMVAYIRHVQSVPRVMQTVRERSVVPMPATHAMLWQSYSKGLAEFVTSVPAVLFAPVDDATLQQEMAAANAAAEKALLDFAEWLASQETNTAFALGKGNYARMLWMRERIDTPLARLKQVAEADLQRNLAALAAACAAYAPDLNERDCITDVEQRKPPEGAVAGAQRQLTGLRQFVLDNNIVSIPSEELALVAEAPPHKRANFAYIDVPGPYEKSVPAVYYIAPPDPSWSEQAQLAYIPGEATLLGVSVHEVWPGHFLQGLHANLSDNPVSELQWSYAFGEGWAHYTEELMVQQGLGEGSPDVKIGQLVKALMRNVRFLSSLGLHTEGMTVAESEQLFIDKGFQDPGNARQQAVRGTADPGYLFYTVGKLMIMKLRDDWLAVSETRNLNQFHDQFLSYGDLPIRLIRSQMLGDADDGQLFY
jgi:hypothetical protein